MKIELRYLDRKTGRKVRAGSPGGLDALADVRETVLQYRYEYDPPDSPYPQKWWTEWADVPTVKEEDATPDQA